MVDLPLTEAQCAFRDDVRAFLQAQLPAELARLTRLGLQVPLPDLLAWQEVLRQKGWLAHGWPSEYGGPGWTLVEWHIFDGECRRAHAPPIHSFNFVMLGPAIIRFGTDEQKAHYLPRILRSEDIWCQGYSEPGSGSDLASLTTRAVRDGDDYIVNGAKIWTPAAHFATNIFALVRTDPDAKPQRGISFLLIDITSPGIEILPIYALNGRRLWNQVVFEDVRVPAANLLGKENEGWTVAKGLLGDERFMGSRIGESKRLLSVVKAAAGAESAQGGRLIDEADFTLRLAELERRLMALETLALQLLHRGDSGEPVGAEPSMLKLLGSPLLQAMDEAMIEACAYYGAPDAAAYLFGGANEVPPGAEHAVAAMSNYLHHRGFTIAGGTSEVQTGIIAKAVLGM